MLSLNMLRRIPGTVECDACIMDGCSMRHGAVGAVAGVRNPIALADALLRAQDTALPGNLEPPTYETA